MNKKTNLKNQEVRKEEKKRRKFIFWWWFGGGLATLSLLITAAFALPNNTSSSSALSSSSTSVASSSVSSASSAAVSTQKSLVAVEVDKLPLKLSYLTTDIVSVGGGTLRVVYSDYSVQYVPMTDQMIDYSRLVTSKVGQTSVTLKYTYNNETKYVSYPINIVPFVITPTKVTLDITNTDVRFEQQLDLKLLVEPSNASVNTITWSSSDPSIAIVDEFGVVTPKNQGVVTINVLVDGILTASSTLNILPRVITTPVGGGEEDNQQQVVNPLALLEAESFDTPLTDAELITAGWIPISTVQELDWIRGSTSGAKTFSNGTQGDASDDLTFTFVSTLSDANNALRGKYFLKNDLNLGIAPYNTSAGWFPINIFRGQFDGRGYTISNLFIDNSTNSRVVGLFGEINGATIKNLNVTVKSVTNNAALGNQYTSAVAGYSTNSTLERIAVYNVEPTSEIKGFTSVGGVVGQAINTKFLRIYNGVNVTATNSQAGGIVATTLDSSWIVDSHNNGNVTAPNYVGGVAFRVSYSNIPAGSSLNSYVLRSYNSGNVTATGGGTKYIGAIVGSIFYGANIEYVLFNNYFLKNDSINTNLKAFGRTEPSSSPAENERDIANKGMPLDADQLFNVDSFEDWSIASDLSTSGKTWIIDNENYALVRRPILNFQVIEKVELSDGWIPIATAAELDWIRLATNGSKTFSNGSNPDITVEFNSTYSNLNNALRRKYYLINDINLSSFSTAPGWVPIGTTANPYTGHFNGLGFGISNMSINDTSLSAYGLFGSISNSKIENINIYDSIISTSGIKLIGTLVGFTLNTNSINNVHIINSSVTGARGVGGLVGYVDTPGVAKIYSSSYQGIVNILNTGSIDNNNHRTYGGLVGYAGSVEIDNSYANVEIKGTIREVNYYDGAGGLVGLASNLASITNSYARGSLEINLYGYYGGLIGVRVSGSVVNVVNSYSAIDYLIDNSRDIPNLGKIGSIVGQVVSGSNTTTTITNSYYDDTKTKVAKSDLAILNPLGTSKLTGEMKLEDTYADWDFENIWDINENYNQGYPFLRHEFFRYINAGWIPLSSITDLQKVATSLSGVDYVFASGTDYQVTVENKNVTYMKSARYFLINDIDLSSVNNWIPIGSSGDGFYGILNGNNFAIKNLKITKTTGDQSGTGLFKELLNSKITNLKITGAQLNIAAETWGSGMWVGIIAGKAVNTTVSNISITNSSISAVNYLRLGNLFGDVTSVNILNTVVDSNILISTVFPVDSPNNAIYVGGLIGMSNGNTIIQNTFNFGDTVYQGEGVGGFVGTSFDSIKFENVANYGVVTGARMVGGLVGLVYSNISIDDSFVSGQISSTSNIRRGTLIGVYLTTKTKTITSSIYLKDGSINSGLYSIGTLTSDGITYNEQSSDSNGSSSKILSDLADPDTYTNLGWDMENIWIINQNLSLPYPRIYNN